MNTLIVVRVAFHSSYARFNILVSDRVINQCLLDFPKTISLHYNVTYRVIGAYILSIAILCANMFQRDVGS